MRSSPGCLAAVVVTYCPSRMVEYPKSWVTQPGCRSGIATVYSIASAGVTFGTLGTGTTGMTGTTCPTQVFAQPSWQQRPWPGQSVSGWPGDQQLAPGWPAHSYCDRGGAAGHCRDCYVIAMQEIWKMSAYLGGDAANGRVDGIVTGCPLEKLDKDD